jgi:hypothetical protein
VIAETSVARLYGRERELAMLGELVTRVGEPGGSLVVRGEAGTGKSALLSETGRLARERGLVVPKTTGVESEAHLPFAGLHQLLRPILAEIDALPGPQRAAISAAFGRSDEAAPDIFLIALAALDLLVEVSGGSPLLLVVDDAHWLDRPSCDVLAFVARRVELEPIALLFAVRDGFDDPFEAADLPELRVEGLDDARALELLGANAPDLAPDVRKRLLGAGRHSHVPPRGRGRSRRRRGRGAARGCEVEGSELAVPSSAPAARVRRLAPPPPEGGRVARAVARGAGGVPDLPEARDHLARPARRRSWPARGGVVSPVI